MDKARRPQLRIGPLSKPILPPNDEHRTAAECGNKFDEMLKEALSG